MTDHDLESAPPRGVRTMGVVRWVLILSMATVAAVSVLSYFGLSFAGTASTQTAKSFYCPMHPQIVRDQTGECPICHMTLVPRPEGAVKPAATMQPAGDAGAAAGKYHCPMHPHVTSDDPDAKCSLCGGMKLMPRPGTAGAPAPIPGLVPVDVPMERVQKIGVRTAPVTRESLTSGLHAVGVVAASERGLAQISPRFSGWIEQLLVAETGQKVRRGEVMATIYSPDVLQAQQELLTALGWSGGGEAHPGHVASPQAMVEDARRRLELLGIGPHEIDAVVKSRKAERAIAIRSPVDGFVISKNAVAGMSVASGMALFEVADLSTVWVIADIYESDLRRIRVGQPARFETAAYAGEMFSGKVQFIHPTLSQASRTLRVRLEFRNRPGPGGLKLRPGMYGNVRLDLPETKGLMVAAEAVVDTGEAQYVFVVKAHGHFEPRRLKLGARIDDKFEVQEGLAEGEVVVTTANFLIDSESRLRAAIQGQGP